MGNKQNYIWIFGENEGYTADNNSYYFWKEVVNIKDGIDKYLVIEKNEKTTPVYNKLTDHEKQFIIWKDSQQHLKIYYEADLFFVTLSYRDVVPTEYHIDDEFSILRSLIYLGHGTTGMKRIEYRGTSYWNKLFRFLTYNPQELVKNNDFAEYQIIYAPYQPRYGELVRKDEKCDKNQILWFITWREYFEISSEREIFSKQVVDVLKSEELKDYLKENNLILKLCVHQFFDEKIFKDIYKNEQKGLIEIVHSKNIDVMNELVKSKLLITDYSSIAYDFTLLERPVLLYQPDLDTFNETRGFYCDVEDLEANNIETSEELINSIISDSAEVNPFFRDIFPDEIDYESVKSNLHIRDMYNDFVSLQKNKVTILGLNFYEHSNIVSSTMTLTEELLKSNYLVELISLHRNERRFTQPNGLNMIQFNDIGLHSKSEKIKYKLFNRNEDSYLKDDYYVDRFHPHTAYTTKKMLRDIRSKTVISTQLPLHQYLNESKSEYLKNKVYFFHPPQEYAGNQSLLKDLAIEKSIFLDEEDISYYENHLNLKISGSELIFDSGIADNQILNPINLDSQFLDENYELIINDKEDIDDEELLEEYELLHTLNPRIRKTYIGISFLSINKSNLDNLNKLIDFGNYLKENEINDIKIQVIGKGDYIIEFIDLIIQNDLSDYIMYVNSNFNVVNELRKRDFLLDLENNPKYSINYFLGPLNYTKVFCTKNQKSIEVFEDIPNTFIESYEWLVDQIHNLPKINFKELDDNYKLVLQVNDAKKLESRERLVKFLD